MSMSYLIPVGNYHTNMAAIEKSETSSVMGSFAETLSQLEQTSITSTEAYLTQLQSKFGSGVSVRDLPYNKANVDYIGNATLGHGNVMIAPNILEKMAMDPEARRYYEQKIQEHFDTIPEANAFMAVHGRQIVSRGVIIHADGKVTYYSKSDYTPQEKARLEKAMKEEDEAKAKKKAEERRLNEMALAKYHEYWNQISIQPIVTRTVYSNSINTFGLPQGLGRIQRAR